MVRNYVKKNPDRGLYDTGNMKAALHRAIVLSFNITSQATL